MLFIGKLFISGLFANQPNVYEEVCGAEGEGGGGCNSGGEVLASFFCGNATNLLDLFRRSMYETLPHLQGDSALARLFWVRDSLS